MEQIFYSIPKKLGYFEVDAVLEEAAKATPRNSHRIDPKDENDDSFKP